MNDFIIDNVIRSQVVEDYFYFFESKDIDSIAELFSEDCYLVDWEVGKVVGKKNVINVYSNIFNLIEKIETDISHIHEDPAGILTCEVSLAMGKEKILVADIFEFDEEDKIKALRAYKGS